MSNTPTWLRELIWDTAQWAADACEVFGSFIALDMTQYRLMPVAMVSGAEHELDYYSDPSPYNLDAYFGYFNQLWEHR